MLACVNPLCGTNIRTENLSLPPLALPTLGWLSSFSLPFLLSHCISLLRWRVFAVSAGLHLHPPFWASVSLFRTAWAEDFFLDLQHRAHESKLHREWRTYSHMNLTDLGAFADGLQQCPHTPLFLLQKLLPELGSWVQKLETWDWIQKGRNKAFTMMSFRARRKTRL